MKNCQWCGKELIKLQKQFCSRSCAGHVSGKIGGHNSQKTLKEKRLGFYNSEVQRNNSKKGIDSCRIKKVGFCFDKKWVGVGARLVHKMYPNLSSNNARICQKRRREKGLDCYGYNPEQHKKIASMGGKIGGPIGGKIVSDMQKITKTGLCYNREAQRRGGIKSGPKTMELLRRRSKWIWDGVNFLSESEMKCAMKILSKPILGVNCHIPIGTKTIDFCPQSYDKMFQGCFVEYHPYNTFLHPWETPGSYYSLRRKVLDDYGFNDKKLIVIESLKELKC